MELNADQIRLYAREVLGLSLDGPDAEACLRAVRELRVSGRHLDGVSLPFNADEFVEPAAGARWLDTWPDATADE